MRLLLALLFLPSLALAQATPPPACWPKNFGPFYIGGTGTEVISESLQDNGTYWAWKCPDGRVAFKAVKENWKGPSLTMLAIQAQQYKTVQEALTGMWNLYDTRQAACTPQDPCDPDWQRVAQAAVEAAKALPTPLPPGTTTPTPVPPNPTPNWTVAPAVAGSRPLHRVVDNTLQPTSPPSRVAALPPPKALPCDCSKPLLLGALTYCPPVGMAPLVTLCAAK